MRRMNYTIGTSWLSFSVVGGHIEVFRLLAEAGAHVDLRRNGLNKKGCTALLAQYKHLRLHAQGEVLVLRTLEARANQHLEDAHGITALPFACPHGRVETGPVLLEAGANKDLQNCRTTTPTRP